MTDKDIWCPKFGRYRDFCSTCEVKHKREKTKRDKLVEQFNRRYKG